MKKKRRNKIDFSKCPLVLVEWVDSAYSLGWHWSDGTPTVKHCQSVGWVQKRSRDAITLTANLTMEESPQRCCEITIPVCAIKKIHRL